MRSSTARAAHTILLLVLLLWTPSIFLFFKYGGAVGLALSPLYPLSCVLLWTRWAGHPWLDERRVNRILIGAALATVVLSVAIGHPLAKSGRFGPGSDADEALELAVRAVLHGTSPYGPHTHLGNPITPLPGWIALAIPFVLLGKAAYLNIFWFGLGLAVLRWCRRSSSPSTGPFAWLLLISCPAILYEAATGVDYIANALAVMLTSLGLMIACTEGFVLALVVAFAMGVVLTSRGNFLFLVPLILSRIRQKTGAGRTVFVATFLSLFPISTITIILYLASDSGVGSSPLHVLNKLVLLGPHSSSFGWVALAVTALMSIALSWPSVNASTAAFLRNVAAVQAVLVLGVTLTQLRAGAGPRALSATVYGAFHLCFGIGAFCANRFAAAPPEKR